MNWADEGFLAYGAVRVMDGQIPQRDFVSLQPPLSFYTVAIVFKLFGTSLLSLRAFGLSIYFLIPLLIYGIGRTVTKPWLSFAAALPACVLGLPNFLFVPFAVWQGITATLIAAFFYGQATLRNRHFFAFPAGVFTAASLISRHDQALYFIISVCVLTFVLNLVRDRPISSANLKRVFVLWLSGIAAVLAPLTIYWWVLGALPEMFRQLVVFPVTVYRKTSSLPFPGFSAQVSSSENAVTLLFYILPLVQALATIWLAQSAIRRRFFLKEAILTFLLVWSALFYFQALTRSDVNHLFIALPPFFLLGAYGWHIVLEQIRGRHSFRGKIDIVISVAAAMAASYFLWLLIPVSFPDIRKDNKMLTLNRGGVRTQNVGPTVDFIRQIQGYVPPGRSILCLPYQPMFYFLCERRNPTRWNYLWPGDQTAKDHQDLVEQAKRDPPLVVLITEEQEVLLDAPTILDYVHREYRTAGVFGYVSIYKPASEP